MVPERTRKSTYNNLMALAAIGQLVPGAIYYDYENQKWYGAKNYTELQDMAVGGTPVAGTEYTGVCFGYEAGLAPNAGAEISCFFPYDINFPEDAPGSSYWADSGPESEVVVTFQKDGTPFGTLTIAVGAVDTGTWDITETSFDASVDRLTAVFPDPQDSTWAGVVITLRGVR